MNRLKISILLALITFLLGYLEWGDGQHSFLFESEAHVLKSMLEDPMALMHPLIIAPFIGQILLIVSLFQRYPGKFYVYTGLIFLSLLMFFVLLAGILRLNFKIIISTLPFIASTMMAFIYMRRKIS